MAPTKGQKKKSKQPRAQKSDASKQPRGQKSDARFHFNWKGVMRLDQQTHHIPQWQFDADYSQVPIEPPATQPRGRQIKKLIKRHEELAHPHGVQVINSWTLSPKNITLSRYTCFKQPKDACSFCDVIGKSKPPQSHSVRIRMKHPLFFILIRMKCP